MSDDTKIIWEKALDLDELPEGRVKTVTVENQSYSFGRYFETRERIMVFQSLAD